MKKLAIALALVGFAGASQAAPVTTNYQVNYNGTITDATCVIKVVSSSGFSTSDQQFASALVGNGTPQLNRFLGDTWLPTDIKALTNSSLSDAAGRDTVNFAVECIAAATDVKVDMTAVSSTSTEGYLTAGTAAGAGIAIGNASSGVGTGEIYNLSSSNNLVPASPVAAGGTIPFTLVAGIVRTDPATQAGTGSVAGSVNLALTYN